MNYHSNQKLFFPFIIIQLFFITITSLYANTNEDIENKVDEYIGAYVKMNQKQNFSLKKWMLKFPLLEMKAKKLRN